MLKVIFACVHNAGRSQMAAAFFNRLADPQKAQALSAGTEPAARVHPEVQSVMQEVGIDLSDAKPQKLMARQMIQMTDGLSGTLGKGRVTCYMCHHGDDRPRTVHPSFPDLKYPQ